MTAGIDGEGAEPRAKHLVESLVAGGALVILAPVLALIAGAVKISSPGPVLYRSERLGRDGRRFNLYKFRSMHVGSAAKRAADGSLLVDVRDARVTPIGRVLRVGLDELPQLWNVVRGDMNLIGPRPDLPHAMELYTPEQRLRLAVRPGITGLAQVAGRTDIPWSERLALDVRYVREQSLALDLRVAAKTLLEFIPPLRRFSRQPRSNRSASVLGHPTAQQRE